MNGENQEIKSIQAAIAKLFPYVNRLFFIFLIILVICWTIYALVIWLFGLNSSTIIYWLAISNDIFPVLAKITIITFVFGMPAFFIFLLVTAIHTRTRDKIGARVIVLLFFAMGCAGIALCGQTLQLGPFGYVEHMSSVSLNNEFYHLMFYTLDETEGSFIRFYHCDDLDLFCHEVYSLGTWMLPIEGDLENNSIQLAADDISVWVEVNGEVVYTYHP